MDFKKIITVGNHTVGIVFDEDEQAYVVIDNMTGERAKFDTYPLAVEEMQILVCDMLNEYFDDVFEDVLVS